MSALETPKGAEKHAKAQKIDFLEHHIPAIRSGNYAMWVQQEIWSIAGAKNPVALDVNALALQIGAIPETGTNLLCAAKIDNAWHFRVFDAKSQRARDARSDNLSGREDAAAKLCAVLDELKPDAIPTGASAKSLCAQIAALIGVTYQASQSLTVAGERYALNPQDVISVFPPNNSTGDHGNVLPHIILKRSTLPWERLCTKDAPKDENLSGYQPVPWMGLLVFTDEVGMPAPKMRTIKLGTKGVAAADTLYGDSSVSYLRPEWLEPEGGETDDQKVKVIDVPWKTLEPILPKRADLPFLSHVRQRESGFNEPVGIEHSVVIANRLPRRGVPSVVYLVSFEHRYNDTEFDVVDTVKNAAAQVGTSPLVRLVVLKSWRFSCLNECTYLVTKALRAKMRTPDWKPIADYLDDPEGGAALIGTKYPNRKEFLRRLGPLSEADQKKLADAARSDPLNFKSLLMNLNSDVLRLPDQKIEQVHSIDPDAADHMREGNSLLPHHLRNGHSTASWYRGPLATGSTLPLGVLPHARAADQLLRYNTETKFLDTSYAAAWELGRMMMLMAKPVSLALFGWKRTQAAYFKGAANRLSHLPFSRLPGSLDMPELLRSWVYQTGLLDGIPANYLIPDPELVPLESIRFFQLDQAWIESLIDGALSIGRQNSNDVALDAQYEVEFGRPLDNAICPSTGRAWPKEGASGVLIRSDVVAGWPHFQVDGIAHLDAAEMKGHGLERAQVIEQLSKAAPIDGALYELFNDLEMGLPEPGQMQSHLIKHDVHGDAKAWIIADEADNPIFRVDRPMSNSNRLDVTLPRLRQSRLSKNTLLALFHGRVDAVDAHLKPEAIHFGVSESDSRHDNHYKQLRFPETGVEIEGQFVEELPWANGKTNDGTSRVLDIFGLAEKFALALHKTPAKRKAEPLTSADFALQMVEGVARVRYVLSGA